jgi:RNA polymerase sigma-70 factor (ECF subfamily)
MHATPASLLDRLRSPADAEAWVRFVRLYTPFLFHWARKRGLPADDTADLVQEVFAQLLKALPTFTYDPKRSFRAWLAVVVGNKWRELNRKRRPQTVPAADLAERPSPPDEFDDREYRTHIASRALRLIQDEFATPTWQAFWAVVVDERPAKEVAAKLGLSPNAIYLARARVLRRLRAELAGLMD